MKDRISTYHQALLRLDELETEADSLFGTCSSDASELLNDVLEVLSDLELPAEIGCKDTSYCANEDPSYALKRLIEYGRLKFSDALASELQWNLGNEKRWAFDAQDLMANKVGEPVDFMTGEKMRSYPSLDHAYGAVLGDIKKIENEIDRGNVTQAAELYFDGKDAASKESASREAFYTDASRAATDFRRIEFVKGVGIVAVAAGASAVTSSAAIFFGVSPEISGILLAPAAFNTVALAGHENLIKSDRTVSGDIKNWLYEYAFIASMFRYLGVAKGALVGKTLASETAKRGAIDWAKGYLATSAAFATWSPMEGAAKQAFEFGKIDNNILYQTTASPEALLEQQAFLLAIEIFGYPINLAARPLEVAARTRYLEKAYEKYLNAVQKLEAATLAPGRDLALQAGTLGEPPKDTTPAGLIREYVPVKGQRTLRNVMLAAYRKIKGNDSATLDRITLKDFQEVLEETFDALINETENREGKRGDPRAAKNALPLLFKLVDAAVKARRKIPLAKFDEYEAARKRYGDTVKPETSTAPEAAPAANKKAPPKTPDELTRESGYVTIDEMVDGKEIRIKVISINADSYRVRVKVGEHDAKHRHIFFKRIGNGFNANYRPSPEERELLTGIDKKAVIAAINSYFRRACEAKRTNRGWRDRGAPRVHRGTPQGPIFHKDPTAPAPSPLGERTTQPAQRPKSPPKTAAGMVSEFVPDATHRELRAEFAISLKEMVGSDKPHRLEDLTDQQLPGLISATFRRLNIERTKEYASPRSKNHAIRTLAALFEFIDRVMPLISALEFTARDGESEVTVTVGEILKKLVECDDYKEARTGVADDLPSLGTAVQEEAAPNTGNKRGPLDRMTPKRQGSRAAQLLADHMPAAEHLTATLRLRTLMLKVLGTGRRTKAGRLNSIKDNELPMVLAKTTAILISRLREAERRKKFAQEDYDMLKRLGKLFNALGGNFNRSKAAKDCHKALPRYKKTGTLPPEKVKKYGKRYVIDSAKIKRVWKVSPTTMDIVRARSTRTRYHPVGTFENRELKLYIGGTVDDYSFVRVNVELGGENIGYVTFRRIRGSLAGFEIYGFRESLKNRFLGGDFPMAKKEAVATAVAESLGVIKPRKKAEGPIPKALRNKRGLRDSHRKERPEPFRGPYNHKPEYDEPIGDRPGGGEVRLGTPPAVASPPPSPAAASTAGDRSERVGYQGKTAANRDMRTGNFPEAIRHLRWVVNRNLNPYQLMLARRDLGICLRATGDLAGSVRELERSARISDTISDPPAQPYAELAISYLMRARSIDDSPSRMEMGRTALRTIDTAIQREPGFSRHYCIKAEILQLLENNPAALTAVNLAIALDEKDRREKSHWGGDHNFHYIKADILWRLGRHSQALESINRALEIAPSSPKYQGFKARLVLRCAHPSAANPEVTKEALNTALELARAARKDNPENFNNREHEIEALLRLAGLHRNKPERRRELFETALKAIEDMKTLGPTRGIQKAYEVEALAGLGEARYEEAIAITRASIKEDLRVSQAYRRIAEVMSEIGQHDLAIIIAGRARDNERENPVNWAKLAEIYEAAKRFTPAMETAEEGIEELEGKAPIDRLVEALIRVRLKAGKISDAEHATRMAREAGISEAIIAKAYRAARREPPPVGSSLGIATFPAQPRKEVGTVTGKGEKNAVGEFLEGARRAGSPRTVEQADGYIIPDAAMPKQTAEAPAAPPGVKDDGPEFIPRDVGFAGLALTGSLERTTIGTIGGHALTLTIQNGLDTPGSTRTIDVQVGGAWCRSVVLICKDDGTYEIHDDTDLRGAQTKDVRVRKKYIMPALKAWIEIANGKKLGKPAETPTPAPAPAYKVLVRTSMQNAAKDGEFKPVAEIGDKLLWISIPDKISEDASAANVEVKLGSAEDGEEVGFIVMEKLENGKWLARPADSELKTRSKNGSYVSKQIVIDAIEDALAPPDKIQ